MIRSYLVGATLLCASLNLLHGQKNVTVLPDISYVDGGGHKQQLDLFLPQKKNFPTLLLVHGGSLTGGDRKDTNEPYGKIAKTFAENGIACAVMSYRLFPEVDWPVPAQDVASAFSWLHTYIDKYGGNTEKIFLLGHSSGGVLVTLVASDPRYLKPYGLSSQSIAGVMPMGCRLNWDDSELLNGVAPDRVQNYFRNDSWGARFGSIEAIRSFRPMNYVGGHLPPMLILIAEMERFQPPILEDAEIYVKAVKEAGVELDIAILPDRTHYSSIRKMVSARDTTFKVVLDFIRRVSG